MVKTLLPRCGLAATLQEADILPARCDVTRASPVASGPRLTHVDIKWTVTKKKIS